VKRQWAPAADRLIIAELAGTAQRLSGQWQEPSEADIAAAAAELRAVARGRDDLLAERAGVLIGFYGDDPQPQNRTRAYTQARFLLAAMASPDEDLVLAWTETGQERRRHADTPSHGIKGTPDAVA
jgi:hypothetical protein